MGVFGIATPAARTCGSTQDTRRLPDRKLGRSNWCGLTIWGVEAKNPDAAFAHCLNTRKFWNSGTHLQRKLTPSQCLIQSLQYP